MSPALRSTSSVATSDFGKFTIFVAGFVSFGGILFGYDSANIGGVVGMSQWLKVFGSECPLGSDAGASTIIDGVQYCISTSDKSLVTSFLSLGTFVGAVLGYPIADFLGRRSGLMVAASIFIIGTTIQTAVSNVPGIVAGRIIAGLGVGLVSMMTPLYQSESAPPKVRGALVSCYQLAITIGILVAQLVDFATADFTTQAAFRVPIGLQILWGMILLVGCFFIPESPRYYVLKGRPEDARVALARLRGQAQDSEFVNTEMAEMEANHAHEMSLGVPSYAACFKGNMLSRTLCGIFVQMFQQLTGVNFIFYYGTTYFIAAGIASPYLITVATGVVNVCMTIPGIIMVEKLGRRSFLLYGALWMCMCQLVVGIAAVAAPGQQVAKNLLVAFTLLFIAGFASTWGPGAWVLIAELYPLKFRGRAMSMATASNWFWNWVIAFVVPYITDAGKGNLGSKIAFIWFVTSFTAAIWTYFCVPETRGWTLEQLDEMFESGLTYRQTPKWTPAGFDSAGSIGSSDAKLEKHENETV